MTARWGNSREAWQVWRLVWQEHALWWFGPSYTYTLWPYCAKRERDNL